VKTTAGHALPDQATAGQVSPDQATAGQAPRISVIVPTYNRCGMLRQTLESLAGQRFPSDEFEVIVADDGSSDDTAKMVRSFSGRLRLRYCFQDDQGYRVATARNAGARLASSPVLAFVDSGTLAGPDFVRGHLAAHAAEHGQRAVVGYCFGYRPLDEMSWLTEALTELEPAQVVQRYGEDPSFADFRHSEFARAGEDLGRLAAPWFLFWTVNCSVSAGIFWEVGGFDENYRSWGGEDTELGYRLFRRGVPFAMSRDAWTIELPHERHLNANFQSVGRNGRYFLKKHEEPMAEIAFGAFKDKAPGRIESDCAALESLTQDAADLEVSAELEKAAQDIPAGATVAVFGCGAVLPPSLPSCIVMDFDARLLARALADGRHTGHNAIGLRTPLRTGSVDIVIITSRLSGLWDLWGERLLAEARRIGRQVRGPSPGAEALSPVTGRP
jgi:glycosyltransferase involved in cell wall biosynthesis